VTDTEDIANRTAAGIALAYRPGEAGPVEVTECLLERIAKAKGDNIFITVTSDRARAEARKAEARYAGGTRQGCRSHRDLQLSRRRARQNLGATAMTRFVHTASAQMGPIAKSETRKNTVRRLIALTREAKARGVELVVFTEMALTTFFPRWLIEDEAELDSYYESAMPGPDTQPLFDEAKKLGIGFYLGYAELRAGRGPQAPVQHFDPG
jgi:hypothetical protein